MRLAAIDACRETARKRPPDEQEQEADACNAEATALPWRAQGKQTGKAEGRRKVGRRADVTASAANGIARHRRRKASG